jgi:tRNA (guanine37-N1)-methyltransferase
MTLQVKVVTVCPEAFPGTLGLGVVGRGLKQGAWDLKILNLRDFAPDRHRTVDDTPYGGGAGMVLKPEVVAAALRAAKGTGAHVVYLAPHGRRFDQAKARELAGLARPLVVLCGHYEGVDERVLDAEVNEVLSVGDFVLSGGEPAALCLVDAVVRLLPGVLGAAASLHEESFDLIDPLDGSVLVEYPHYTRPAVWEGQAVPAVLQNGNHAEIGAWRLEQARQRTKARG